MSRQDIDVVLDLFAACNERDFARAMRHYSEDVELYVDPEAFLEAGTIKGREAVGRYFGDWFATFDAGFRFEVEEAGELGDKVLLIAAYRGTGRTSGVESRRRTAYLYTVDGGKIARAELYPDREAAVAAAGAQG